MKKLFYRWLWERFYKRVQDVDKQMFHKNGSYHSNLCTRLQFIMREIKPHLTGDKS